MTEDPALPPTPELRSDDTDLVFDARGHPCSPRYGDIYKSRAGAVAEALAVFVDGCRLRQRWAGGRGFTVLELGFGLGVNFLATLQAWRDDPRRPTRLQFVAIEAHPVSAEALRTALGALAVRGSDAEALIAQWPLTTPGLHRLRFADGAVVLTLAFGEASRMLPQLAIAADAFFLDGFAPARNPAMWSPALMKGLARIARPGATLATYTAAGAVRDALGSAGFEVRLVPGFGGKRERIDAIYAPRWRTFAPPSERPLWPSRDAIVVGAGIAGCHVAASLAARGWTVTLLERNPGIGREGSNQPLLADHLHVTPDDNPMARLSRSALLLRAADRASADAPVGKLQIADSPAEEARQRATVAGLGFPARYVQALDVDAASEIAGVRVAHGGLWLPLCEAISPAQTCADVLRNGAERIRLRTGSDVRRLVRTDRRWNALDEDGLSIASGSVVVLANAGDAMRLAGLSVAPLRRLRGQTTRVSAPALSTLRCVLGGDAYACPFPDGSALVGSTYDDETSTDPSPEADLSNLRRLRRVLAPQVLPEPESAIDIAPAALSFRHATQDRMPMIGPIPDEAATRASAADLHRNDRLPVPTLPGLYGAFAYGSRGQLWSRLAGELLADLVDGEPTPLERDLMGAVDPARFLRYALRTRRLR